MVKAITVHAKEWWDKINGSSYCAVRVYVDDIEHRIPIEYGYGSYYEQLAGALLKELGILPESHCLYSQCKDKGIIYHSIKEKNCLKRVVKQWGEL